MEPLYSMTKEEFEESQRQARRDCSGVGGYNFGPAVFGCRLGLSVRLHGK